MIISGLQKTTLLDYPGHVAATVFIGGCNFRCPFCHNMNIVNAHSNNDIYEEDEIISFLEKRSSILDGVCITGGEPSLNDDLPNFIRRIKEINKESGEKYLVKLDTNGTNPNMIKELINDNLIDYVAMDIKSSLDKYSDVAGISEFSSLSEKIINTIQILKKSEIEYEFRTTVIEQFHDKKEIKKIGELIKGARKYYLQSFIDSEYVIDHSLKPLSKEILVEYINIISEYVESVEIRGVD